MVAGHRPHLRKSPPRRINRKKSLAAHRFVADDIKRFWQRTAPIGLPRPAAVGILETTNSGLAALERAEGRLSSELSFLVVVWISKLLLIDTLPAGIVYAPRAASACAPVHLGADNSLWSESFVWPFLAVLYSWQFLEIHVPPHMDVFTGSPAGQYCIHRGSTIRVDFRYRRGPSLRSACGPMRVRRTLLSG